MPHPGFVTPSFSFKILAIISCGFAFFCHSAPVAHAAEPKTAPHTILLPLWDADRSISQTTTGMLERELFRQAFLISARDDFGLATRDAGLREPIPDEAPAGALSVDMIVSPVGASRFQISIYPPNGADGAPLLEEKFRFADPPLESMATLAEQLSRTRFPDALAGMGFVRLAPRAVSAASLPEPLASEIDHLNVFAQYNLVRSLHAEIRKQGPSPALLGALIRSYVQLGVLSEVFASPAHKVFKARALIYAERLVQRGDAAKWALWHRGFARAHVGLHASALSDIEASAAAAAGSAANLPTPAWVDVIDAFCRYDLERIAKLQADEKTAGVMDLLLMLSEEGTEFLTNHLRLTQRILKRHPDCLRALYSISKINNLATEREFSAAAPRLLAASFPREVVKTPATPEKVARAANDLVARLDDEKRPVDFLDSLIVALREAGEPTVDREEPSLAVPAILADEAAYQNAFVLLKYLKDWLGVDAEETWIELGPSVKRHPYKAGLAWFRSDTALRNEEIATLYDTLDAAEFQLSESKFLRWMQTADRTKARANLSRFVDAALQHQDRVYTDLLWSGSQVELDSVSGKAIQAKLLAASPRLPHVIARQILLATDAELKDDLAGWETKCSNHPFALLSLADRCDQLDRKQDAERLYERITVVAPEHKSLNALANWYEKQKNEERLIATLERQLEIPSLGLQGASVRSRIARLYMAKREYRKAKPYAVDAAESYAHWALELAMSCCEKLEEWDESESYARAVSNRYDNARHIWFFWCCRTGKGDFDGARRLMEEFIEENREQAIRLGYHLIYCILTDQPKKAVDASVAVGIPVLSRDQALLLAVVADQAKESVTRDRLLQRVIDGAAVDQQKLDDKNRPIPPWEKQLAELFRSKIRLGSRAQFNMTAYENLWKSVDSDIPTEMDYLAGLFLINHGKEADAERLLIRCATSPSDHHYILFARHLLRKSNIKFGPVRTDERPVANAGAAKSK